MKKLTFQILKKNSEAGLIFVTFGLTFTVAWSISIAIILIPFMLGLDALLVATGGASPISLFQSISLATESVLKVAQFSPFPGFLTSFLYLLHTKKEYESFRDEKHLPIYRVQSAVIQSNLGYERLFELCLDSLRFIGHESVKLIISDKESGKIKALVKTIKTFRYKGEVVEFYFENVSSGEIRVRLKSYSNVLVKGMDAAKNIQNLHNIYKYFKDNLNTKEVEICLL